MLTNSAKRNIAGPVVMMILICAFIIVWQSNAGAQEGFIGEIRMFAGNFAPRGWAFCEGQLLPINQNTALYSILGTTYGGDGQTNFALPDLRGRTPIGVGHGPGLSPYSLGQKGGNETTTLSVDQIPAHNHLANASSEAGNTRSPADTVWARGKKFYSTQAPNTTMSATAISSTGGSQPHTNIQPYLAIHYIICIQGIYPSRP